MNLRLLLLPFSWIYGIITFIRNKCYDFGLFQSYGIPAKSICVGNLSTGGTGKTPHVDLLIDIILSSNKNIATLSRGYGRETKGLKEVEISSTALEVGDEPLFYKCKYGDQIKVVVAEKRKEGIDFILRTAPKTEVIILDDAFQHRAVKAEVNIIISDYNHPFYSDFILPAGNLRESRKGIKRAECIIISKCPPNLSKNEMDSIKAKIDFNPDRIFFSRIEYANLTPFSKNINSKVENILLVAGIGNPTPLFEHLSTDFNVKLLQFNDHHVFKPSDIVKIHQKFDTFANGSKIIVTTEKDFMRLKNFKETLNEDYPWFYQPINTIINEKENFNLYINEYVNEI